MNVRCNLPGIEFRGQKARPPEKQPQCTSDFRIELIYISKYWRKYFQNGCLESIAYWPHSWQYIPFNSVPQFLQYLYGGMLFFRLILFSRRNSNSLRNFSFLSCTRAFVLRFNCLALEASFFICSYIFAGRSPKMSVPILTMFAPIRTAIP